jgi:hypothetical protein
MSQRSIYLRDQAAKCEWHASNMGDCETQVRLRKLAAEYVAQASDIESNPQAENSLGLCRIRFDGCWNRRQNPNHGPG